MNELTLTITPELVGLRLDKALLKAFPQHFTRSQLKALGVKVFDAHGRPFKLSYHVNCEQIFHLSWQKSHEEDKSLVGNDLPLKIIYEDQNCLVVDKEAGMVIHPGNGHSSGTLVNALLFHVTSLAQSFSYDKLRPGLVHRLDKDTSGLVICAKSTVALEYLSRQFRERKTKKSYLAIVLGKLKSSQGSVISYLARDRKNRHKYCEVNNSQIGREAVTEWKVLVEWEKSSLVELRPITGRTHQLRVHMKGQGNPILGDMLYSRNAKEYSRLYLHAWRLSISLPSDSLSGQHTFFSNIPQDFLDYFQSQDAGYYERKWFISLLKRCSTSP